MIRKTEFGVLKSLAVAGFVGACSAGVSQGALSLTMQNVGGDLVISWTGTIDISHLTPSSTFASNRLDESTTFDRFWANGSGNFTRYTVTAETPTWLQIFTADTGSLTGNASAVSGDSFGLHNTEGSSRAIYLPQGFTNGSISGSGTWSGLGAAFDAGGGAVSQTFNIGGADGLVQINIAAPATIPEPTSALLASLGLGVFAFRRKRKTA